MRSFGWTMLLVLTWISIQLSGLDVLFMSLQVPGVILALAGSLIVVLGFPAGFWWAIGTGILFDILQAGELTWFTLLVALFVSATYFLVRRITLASSGSVKGFLVLLVLITCGGFLGMTQMAWLPLLDIVMIVLITPIVYTSVSWLEDWLRSTSLSEFRGMRPL